MTPGPASAGHAADSSVVGRVTSPAANDVLEIQIFQDMAPLEPEWRALERDSLASLHQSYDWCAAWVETYGNPLAIIRGSIGNRIAFILPIEIVRSNMVRSAQFIAAPRSNINTGLFAADFIEACGDGLTQSQQEQIARALQGKADLLVLQNLPIEWRGRRSPLARLPMVENQNRAFQLPFLDTFEATLNQVNAKRRRKKYRHQTRILEEKGGYDYVVAQTIDAQVDLLDLFFQQKATRFKAAGLPNVFQSPETHAFLKRLLTLRDEDRSYIGLEMHALRLKGEHDGHIPAIAALSRKGDHVICQFASIDESMVPEASPGELLFWLMLERLQQDQVALFDFGIGDQLYKRSWCPVETIQYDAILPVSAIGHVAAFAQRGVTRTKTMVKSNPQLYAFIQRLRSHGDAKPPVDTADAD